MSVQVDGLSKKYGSQHAVNNLSFSVGKGEILGFLGPNGAGKTTTMKMLTTYISPSDGDARVCGYSIINNPMDVKRSIGYLPEHNPLYKDMYVKEYLLCFARISAVSNPMQRVSSLIEMTGLTIEQHKQIGSLSKGYRQRVGLSQALIHDPQVLILDEPTSGLDPNQLKEIRTLIKNIGVEKTLIFSTHIMQEVHALCDRVVIINQGSKVADSTIDALQDQMEAKQVIRVEFGQDIDRDALSRIKGVTKVKAIGNNIYNITAAKDTEIRDSIFDLCVERKWKLREMNREKNTMENIFTELTLSDKS